MPDAPPRVFVSHASEDKERFVLGFARRLRANGVDAWLDRWEMLPGDSIVDKIFEEGLKSAQAVVAVVSKNSIDKPWVREELSASVVKRINTGSKLIPVVIDDCEVPAALKSTVWQRINDLAAYDEDLQRILAAIFGSYDKPPIGEAPTYTRSFTQTIGELNNVDSLVLRLACDRALEDNNDLIDPNVLYKKDGVFFIPEVELSDAIEILEQQGLVRVHHLIGPALSSFQVATAGFEAYARACVSGYDAVIADVVVAIVNRKEESDQAIAASLGQPLYLVNHILRLLENNGHIQMSRPISGPQHIVSVAASLRRALSA